MMIRPYKPGTRPGRRCLSFLILAYLISYREKKRYDKIVGFHDVTRITTLRIGTRAYMFFTLPRRVQVEIIRLAALPHTAAPPTGHTGYAPAGEIGLWPHLRVGRRY